MENINNKSSIIDFFLKVFSLLALIIFLYTVYRISVFVINGNDINQIIDKYLKFIIISLLFFIFFLISFRFSVDIKKNIILIFSSLIITLYMIEIIIYFNFKNLVTFENNINIEDRNKKLEKFEKFIEDGIYPFDAFNKEFTFQSDKIFPLSYISNVNTFLCNETGEDIFYVSDDYGFRNNNKVWKEDVEFAFIGDSFVHGGCVEDNYTLSNILSKKVNKNVLNLGVGGAGPLIEYAIFKEYASKKKPKKVFWFFSEGTDLTKNLRGEKKIKALIRYLDDEYVQNLISKQDIIDKLLINYVEENTKKKNILEKNEISNVKKINKKINNFLENTRFLRLWSIRNLISFFLLERQIDPLFEEIILKTKERIQTWNGQLYFVYMPESRRYNNQFNRYLLKNKFRNKDKILNMLVKNDIKVIDVDSDIFAKNKDPLSLFNKIKVHYNEKAYEIIASNIANLD